MSVTRKKTKLFWLMEIDQKDLRLGTLLAILVAGSDLLLECMRFLPNIVSPLVGVATAFLAGSIVLRAEPDRFLPSWGLTKAISWATGYVVTLGMILSIITSQAAIDEARIQVEEIGIFYLLSFPFYFLIGATLITLHVLIMIVIGKSMAKIYSNGWSI